MRTQNTENFYFREAIYLINAIKLGWLLMYKI